MEWRLLMGRFYTIICLLVFAIVGTGVFLYSTAGTCLSMGERIAAICLLIVDIAIGAVSILAANYTDDDGHIAFLPLGLPSVPMVDKVEVV
jgi:hypothetical protein